MDDIMKKKKKKKKKTKVTLETIQKEHTSVLQKKKTDVYITSGKPIKIYYDRVIKVLNSGTKQLDLIIDGDNRQPNNLCNPSEGDQVSIYAVGTNILRASYILQDVINFYCNFIRKVQQMARKDKKQKFADVFSFINVDVISKTLHMNDTVISNTYTVKEEFLQDDYDAVIAFAKQPYDPALHKYRERTKERRVTAVVISIKKNPTML
ncbi:conserved Plasmodium protein, unknown function [Plasmodium knowlesi strain H]|uniref:DNA/RNA-binding protein Alba-like domain-containing protein n=2 Tax=Plasmodium knowlesi TaxID=5850 RepID=A0A679KRR6_PLAKH|nr:conserved Plasmodium protein, unknown function [Plasmodium knowlesi strain H]OTN66888.1 Uncharacterized protein PKNOH_S08504400 [Plasmodium knowlesi]CAA9986687.1 conserved Plasmodium protein, unknown function [Plasmodium knowlesi strain H]VVS76161.1 conserved Plasmodium protein, unknown function [Plasmodium knowlesi strain H]